MPRTSAPIASAAFSRSFQPHGSNLKLRGTRHGFGIFARTQRVQPEAITLLDARNQKFLMRPGTPTVVTAHTLLLPIQVQRDEIATGQFKRMFARIQIFRAVVQRVDAQERHSDSQ